MTERKDAPSSVLTGREISTRIQASTNLLNTRKSPRFEKQKEPTPSTIKKKPEQSKKQIGLTPLRRSERVKNPVDVPASKVKSIEKSADISEESAEDVSRDSRGGIIKRKRYNAVEFKARNKSQRVVETEGSEVPVHTESAALGDGTPVANPDGSAESLYQHLQPTVFELCHILKFSESAKNIAERFLKFVVGDFDVSKEDTNILQALMISVCWICSSLSKRTIDRKESLTLATEQLNFSCNEEEADQVYEKLKKRKEMFLQNPINLKLLDGFRDGASQPKDPRKSPAVQLNLQEQKRENHDSANERNEIDKFDREWNEKKMNIVKAFELKKTSILPLYNSYAYIRSGRLNTLEKEFADEMSKHEKLRQVVNEEISLNVPANETQIIETGSHVDSADGSLAIEDAIGTGSNDVASYAKSHELGIPVGNDMASNVDSTNEARAIVVATGPNDILTGPDDGSNVVEDPNKNGSNDTSLHADSESHAVEDPTGTGPNNGLPNVESAELAIVASNCNQDKAQDTTPSVQQGASPVSDHSMSAIPVDQIIAEDSSLNPHDEPSSLSSTDPTTTENQVATTTAPPMTAQAQMQLEQYLFELQRNANFNQAPSLRTGGIDPLRTELLQLSSVKNKMVNSHHDNIKKIKRDCKKEITEAIAEIMSKYNNKRQEADATLNSRQKKVENRMNTVAMSQLLATSFRRKCQNVSLDISDGCAAVQQACQAESMQQQRRPLSPSTYSLGESSGTQPPPPIPATAVARPPQETRSPLQIADQTSDHFTPHTTNLRPANTTSIRPPPIPVTTTTSRLQHRRPPIANLIIPSITTNIPPPMINPITPSTPTITPITPSTTPSSIRSPHGINPHTSSTTPSRLNPFGMSSRPFVSREFRTPAPHMRPFHRVTSSLPLTSPSNSQRLNSPSSIQTPPPQPLSESPQPPPSELPHASAATSAHSSLPCGPSVPQSGCPQDELNDNVNALTDNAAREFPGGGNGAQPPSPSAHDVVYLSDDD